MREILSAGGSAVAECVWLARSLSLSLCVRVRARARNVRSLWFSHRGELISVQDSIAIDVDRGEYLLD